MGVETRHSPNDLMLSRRSIENEVWRWHVAGSTDRLKRSARFLVKVEVCVTNFADLFFGPVSRSFSYRIHADENVGSRQILVVKPGLTWSTRDSLGAQKTPPVLFFFCFSSSPQPHKHKI